MRWIYSLLLILGSPFFVIRLWFKGRKLPGYRARIKERFAVFSPPNGPIDYWFHAVSLGEVNACIPLVDAVFAHTPSAVIAITTMTPTGSARVMKYYADKVFHVYLPYDLPYTVKRFLKRLQPKRAVIMETEIWPNLIHYCHLWGIPILLANARLSEHSFVGYQRLKPVIKPILNKLSLVVAQSDEDGQRFIQLGLSPQCLSILGNIKFDVEPAKFDNREAKVLQQRWGMQRPVWMVASTHHDEERQILSVYRELKKEYQDLLLLLAPRHPERFDEVACLCQQQGFRVVRRTQSDALEQSCEILIIDCIGELMAFFSVATLAFIGGSLVPIGGHNVLEPISLGIPTLSGHYFANFKAIMEQLMRRDGIIVVENLAQMTVEMKRLLADNSQLVAQAERAKAVLVENKGVIGQYVALINALL